MINVIVDTNVFVSALYGSRNCKQIYELIKCDKFNLVISNDLLLEISATLSKLKFGLTDEEISDIAEHLSRKSKRVFPKQKLNVCRDPKDNPLLEAALSGKADFIVTGDKDLLSIGKFHNTIILTPRDFLKFL